MGAEDFHVSRALKGTWFRMQTYSSLSTYGASRLTGSWTNCTEAFTDDHMESERIGGVLKFFNGQDLL